jgi:multisubunit Na+/H+ antiporter MnhB subunit
MSLSEVTFILIFDNLAILLILQYKAELEETLKRMQEHPGVTGLIVLNSDGIIYVVVTVVVLIIVIAIQSNTITTMLSSYAHFKDQEMIDYSSRTFLL